MYMCAKQNYDSFSQSKGNKLNFLHPAHKTLSSYFERLQLRDSLRFQFAIIIPLLIIYGECKRL